MKIDIDLDRFRLKYEDLNAGDVFEYNTNLCIKGEEFELNGVNSFNFHSNRLIHVNNDEQVIRISNVTLAKIPEVGFKTTNNKKDII